ncbi:MAG: hypothetical protein KBC34_00840 [Phenylobacterium sp.]|nr:hypothetical protein [Phenylobacterium sp.]
MAPTTRSKASKLRALLLDFACVLMFCAAVVATIQSRIAGDIHAAHWSEIAALLALMLLLALLQRSPAHDTRTRNDAAAGDDQ